MTTPCAICSQRTEHKHEMAKCEYCGRPGVLGNALFAVCDSEKCVQLAGSVRVERMRVAAGR